MTLPQDPTGDREQAGEAAVRGERRVAGTGENWAGRVDHDEHREDVPPAGCSEGGVITGEEVIAVKSGCDTDVTMPPPPTLVVAYMRAEAKGWLRPCRKQQK